MSQSRFSYNDPPHWANPALIDWHVYDDGERISISRLVREANQLQREVEALKAAIPKPEETAVSSVQPQSP